MVRQYVHAWLCERGASEELHQKVDDLPPIRAVWVNQVCDPKVTTDPVVIFQGRCLGGVTWGPDGPTYVAVSKSGLLGPTSYVHETAHIWHAVVLSSSGDPGHLDEEWWAYFLDVIRPAVVAAELQTQ